MNSLVAKQLQQIQTDFSDSLSAHLHTIAKREIYGYAILLGEDIDMCDAVAVTNGEADLAEHIGSEDENSYRYVPDEWAEWHQDAFDSFNARLEDVYETFRDLCPEEEEVFIYNDQESAYIRDVHELYLNAARQCVADGAFGDIWYRIIYISDSDYPIIGESLNALNTGRPITEAGPLFDD